MAYQKNNNRNNSDNKPRRSFDKSARPSSTSARLEDRKGNRPNHKSGGKPELRAGDRPAKKFASKPGFKSGDKPTGKFGGKAGSSAGEKPFKKFGSKPGFRSDDQSEKSSRSPRPQRGEPNRPARQESRPSGFEARALAVDVLHDIMMRGRTLDDSLTRALSTPEGQALEGRDRALARLIVMTVLRRHGDLTKVLDTYLEKSLSDNTGKVWPILLMGAAQLLCLEVAPHAAISLSVDVAYAEPTSVRYAKLINAILRRVSDHGRETFAQESRAENNFPDWMLASWRGAYGQDTAQQIAEACLTEPNLDISVKSDAVAWAEKLGGQILAPGSLRIVAQGRIEELAGFETGEWWVQDVAATLPVLLLGPVAGQKIADLCAAPGGKTMQLAAAGAEVTAVDSSLTRIERLKENLTRTGLTASVIAADVATWRPDEAFDGVLLDAPCSATGTIRRHPDILHLKRQGDLAPVTRLQANLLTSAAKWVRPGGVLIYCTCSLQPEEGEQQIARFLERNRNFEREPIVAGTDGIAPEWLTEHGDLRTLPHFNAGAGTDAVGMDGFFAARLRRRQE